jgi:hypothetical protein
VTNNCCPAVHLQMFFIGGEFLLVLVAYVLQQWHGM